MATRTVAQAQKFAHLNSTLTTTAAAKTFPAKTNFILIFNPDATNDVKYSLDAAVTFGTIKPGSSLSLDCDDFMNRNTLQLKSSASTIAVEILYGYEV